MKNLLVGITLLASVSAFADPVLPCDRSEIGNLLQTAETLEVNKDFSVFAVTVEGKEGVLTVDRDCDFWDLEIIGQ